jgi:hypothetical protein
VKADFLKCAASSRRLPHNVAEQKESSEHLPVSRHATALHVITSTAFNCLRQAGHKPTFPQLREKMLENRCFLLSISGARDLATTKFVGLTSAKRPLSRSFAKKC